MDAYRIWRLDAKQGSQAVQSFDQPLLLFVSAKDLVAQGVDAAQLGLWTRETGDELWTPVAADYDPVQQSFRAALPHFSKFSPGAGLSQPGELLGARPHNRMRAARPLHPHPSSFALALPRRIQCPLHG